MKKLKLLLTVLLPLKLVYQKIFLSKSLAKLLKNNIEQLNNDGRMLSAGIGNNSEKNQDKEIRSDKIFWLDKKNKIDNEKEFIDQIEDFIDYLNKTCFTNIKNYEFHYALYEVGSFYKMHKDQFNNDNGRKFSIISYLNEDWLENDGGQLLIYQSEKTQKILPNNQKAVFFQSDLIKHEVTLANRPRMSISGWLKTN